MAKQTLGLEVQSSDSREVQINGTHSVLHALAEAEKNSHSANKRVQKKLWYLLANLSDDFDLIRSVWHIPSFTS